jgi:uncharacterized protein (UPF0333 family)
MDNKGQISIELIIVIAAILAVALIFIKNFSNSADKSVKKFNNKTEEILKELDSIK